MSRSYAPAGTSRPGMSQPIEESCLDSPGSLLGEVGSGATCAQSAPRVGSGASCAQSAPLEPPLWDPGLPSLSRGGDFTLDELLLHFEPKSGDCRQGSPQVRPEALLPSGSAEHSVPLGSKNTQHLHIASVTRSQSEVSTTAVAAREGLGGNVKEIPMGCECHGARGLNTSTQVPHRPTDVPSPMPNWDGPSGSIMEETTRRPSGDSTSQNSSPGVLRHHSQGTQLGAALQTSTEALSNRQDPFLGEFHLSSMHLSAANPEGNPALTRHLSEEASSLEPVTPPPTQPAAKQLKPSGEIQARRVHENTQRWDTWSLALLQLRAMEASANPCPVKCKEVRPCAAMCSKNAARCFGSTALCTCKRKWGASLHESDLLVPAVEDCRAQNDLNLTCTFREHGTVGNWPRKKAQSEHALLWKNIAWKLTG